MGGRKGGQQQLTARRPDWLRIKLGDTMFRMAAARRMMLTTTPQLDTRVERSPSAGFYLIRMFDNDAEVAVEIERGAAQRLAAQISTQVNDDLQRTEDQLRKWIGTAH